MGRGILAHELGVEDAGPRATNSAGVREIRKCMTGRLAGHLALLMCGTTARSDDTNAVQPQNVGALSGTQVPKRATQAASAERVKRTVWPSNNGPKRQEASIRIEFDVEAGPQKKRHLHNRSTVDHRMGSYLGRKLGVVAEHGS